MADGSDVQITVTIEPEDARKMAADVVALRAELADVRAQWQADVGSAIARAQTAEARVTQADWRIVQLVKDLDAARAEAARLRSALITYADASEMVLKALPASIVNETEELWGVTNTKLVRRALSYLWHCAALRGPEQSEKRE